MSGEKICVFYLGSKIFSSRTQLRESYRDLGYLISFFCHLSSLLSSAIELVCLYKQKNKPDVKF